MSDLPQRHCTQKPKHSFCTVCYRINHAVAWDCPLRELPEPRTPPVGVPVPRPAPSPFAPAGPPLPPEAYLPESPVIEFAPHSEPRVEKRRVKARAVEKRPAPAAPAGPAPTLLASPENLEFAGEFGPSPAEAPPAPTDDGAEPYAEGEARMKEVLLELRFPEEKPPPAQKKK